METRSIDSNSVVSSFPRACPSLHESNPVRQDGTERKEAESDLWVYTALLILI